MAQAHDDIAAIGQVAIAEFVRPRWAALEGGLTLVDLQGDVTRSRASGARGGPCRRAAPARDRVRERHEPALRARRDASRRVRDACGARRVPEPHRAATRRRERAPRRLWRPRRHPAGAGGCAGAAGAQSARAASRGRDRRGRRRSRVHRRAHAGDWHRPRPCVGATPRQRGYAGSHSAHVTAVGRAARSHAPHARRRRGGARRGAARRRWTPAAHARTSLCDRPGLCVRARA